MTRSLEKKQARERCNRKIYAEKWPDRVRACYIKREYGISWEEYIKLYETQQGNCALCFDPISPFKSLDTKYPVAHVDHCHKTGKIRGLLCGLCNKGIGHLRDDPQLCRLAAEYLERR